MKVVATDQLGHEAEQVFEVTLPSAGELLLPGDGTHTSGNLPLQARADAAGMTSVRFQYRRPFGTWADVPLHTLTDADGLPLGTRSSRSISRA